MGLAGQDFGKPNDLRKIEVSENHRISYYFLGLISCRHRMDHRSDASRDSAVFSSITTGGPHEFFGYTGSETDTEW